MKGVGKIIITNILKFFSNTSLKFHNSKRFEKNNLKKKRK